MRTSLVSFGMLAFALTSCATPDDLRTRHARREFYEFLGTIMDRERVTPGGGRIPIKPPFNYIEWGEWEDPGMFRAIVIFSDPSTELTCAISISAPLEPALFAEFIKQQCNVSVILDSDGCTLKTLEPVALKVVIREPEDCESRLITSNGTNICDWSCAIQPPP